jgi:hypothetical protein
MWNIEDWWSAFYGSATPISYILRREIPGRWMRIHSLPESKRYAETAREYSLLLSRHNEVAADILGLKSRCVLFVGQHVEHPEEKIVFSDCSELENTDFNLFKTIENYETNADPVFGPDIISIWFAIVTWSSGQFDELIKIVADDQLRHVLFASCETGEAYAPYDGGADLFLVSTKRRNELKRRYEQWLSKHPEGL